jgi:carbamoyl-phosphate synthase large subunit
MPVHTVLVTGIGGDVGQGIVKSLSASQRQFRTIGIDMEPLSAGFAMTDTGHRVPRCGTPEFVGRLGEILQTQRVEAIYVCSPAELDFFSRQKDDLQARFGTTVLVNPLEIVRVASDKLATAAFLKEAGFPSPLTCLATDQAALEALLQRCGFPVIIKPRFGASSRNVWKVCSHKELQAAQVLTQEPMIVQEYLADAEQEYTASTMSGRDRRVRAVIVLRRQLNNGTTYRTELVEDEDLADKVKAVVEDLGAECACNVQFRIRDGQPYVFEINPRFSGTAGIRYRYGFNDAEMAFELLQLGLEVQQPKLRPAVVLRYWEEIVIPGASFASLREQIGHGPSTALGSVPFRRSA